VALTDGLFDPGLGATLRALGYDRSFAPGALDRARAGALPPAGGFTDVRLEPSTRRVLRPAHVHIDLGGLAKGATVDLAARQLGARGAIDAGGDAILCGPGPEGDGWLVDVEDPADPARTLATVAVIDAAVATSAPNRRRWRLGDGIAHHLVDPRTRTSAVSDLLQATVVAPTAERADVLAKTAFLLGARAGRAFLERQPDTGGILVGEHGRPVFVGRLDVREVAHA
jgi:thiamine biosynthesis lipoprotein